MDSLIQMRLSKKYTSTLKKFADDEGISASLVAKKLLCAKLDAISIRIQKEDRVKAESESIRIHDDLKSFTDDLFSD